MDDVEPERAHLLSLLSRWHDARPWARRAVEASEVERIDVVGPVQIVLRSVFESRRVQFQVGPAERPLRSEELDLWSIELEVPDDAPVGAEVSQTIERSLRMDCGMCLGRGEEVSLAYATGSSRLDDPPACATCRGMGGVLAVPTVHAKVEEHVATHQLGTDDLPLEIAFALLDDHAHEGRLLHEQEAPRIRELRTRDGGYRGHSGHAEWAAAVRDLCLTLDLPPNVRVLRQRLELRRIPVYVVHLTDGTTFHLWGERTPAIHPPHALSSVPGQLLRVLAWVAP